MKPGEIVYTSEEARAKRSMIVQTWCGSYAEITLDNLVPWLKGWFFALLHPVFTFRVRRNRIGSADSPPDNNTFLFFTFPKRHDRIFVLVLHGCYSEEKLRSMLQKIRPGAKYVRSTVISRELPACTVH